MTDAQQVKQLPGTSTGWHVQPAVLAAYLEGSVSEATAWSTEEHLMSCTSCRTQLTLAAPAPALEVVIAVRGRLLAALPAQGRVRAGSRTRRLRVLVGSPPGPLRAWAAAVLFVLAWAVVLDLLHVPLSPGAVGRGSGLVAFGLAGPGQARTVPAAGWLQLLAPLLPIAGVACSYGAADPARELLASTPAGGLRLLLHRLCAVVAACVPLAAAVGLMTGGIDGVAWLMPALALTVLTLAAGSVVDLGVAATVAGAGWLVVMGGPLLAGRVPPAVTVQAVPAWSAALAIAAVVVALRADRIRRPAMRMSRAR